jgi:hypothetical protein
MSILNRCITIHMDKRPSNVKLEKFRPRKIRCREDIEKVRRAVADYVEKASKRVAEKSQQDVDDYVAFEGIEISSDRFVDCWEPLYIQADTADEISVTAVMDVTPVTPVIGVTPNGHHYGHAIREAAEWFYKDTQHHTETDRVTLVINNLDEVFNSKEYKGFTSLRTMRY